MRCSISELLLQGLQGRCVVTFNQGGDLMDQLRVVGVVTGEVAAADHGHPGTLRARMHEATPTSHVFAHRIPGAADTTHPLIIQLVLQQRPIQCVGELQSLGQTLLLSFQ